MFRDAQPNLNLLRPTRGLIYLQGQFKNVFIKRIAGYFVQQYFLKELIDLLDFLHRNNIKLNDKLEANIFSWLQPDLPSHTFKIFQKYLSMI